MIELVELFQNAANNPDNPILLLLGLGSLSLFPLLVMGTTSFIKISVVLSIFRNALGAGQLPSTAVSGLLSLALSLHIMAPVIDTMVEKGSHSLKDATGAPLSVERILKQPPEKLATLIEEVFSPLHAFLRKHASLREREYFASLHSSPNQQSVACDSEEPCWIAQERILTLIPAFILSELQSAFAIGFSIFLPFLVIDLVIANLLVGMGMVMVSPITISLPFKILLFVSCDGWFLLCSGLIASYGT